MGGQTGTLRAQSSWSRALGLSSSSQRPHRQLGLHRAKGELGELMKTDPILPSLNQKPFLDLKLPMPHVLLLSISLEKQMPTESQRFLTKSLPGLNSRLWGHGPFSMHLLVLSKDPSNLLFQMAPPPSSPQVQESLYDGYHH